MEERHACDSVAATDTPLSAAEANARQTSDVPLCPLALTTKVQVKPPPATPVTVVFGPDSQSVEMKANNSSLPEVVENVEVTTVVFARAWSTETLASTDIAAKPMFVAARMQHSPKTYLIFMKRSFLCKCLSSAFPPSRVVYPAKWHTSAEFISPGRQSPLSTRDL